MTPIMNIHNNHDVELVNRINFLYNKDEGKFINVLHELALRYKDEIANTLGIIEELGKPIVKTFAYEILMHICDNQDLEYICNRLENECKSLKVFTAQPKNAYSGGCVIFATYDIVDAKKLLQEIENSINDNWYGIMVKLGGIKELQGVKYVGKRGLIDDFTYIE